MSNQNHLSISGNLVKAPEVKTAASGVTRAMFSIAQNRVNPNTGDKKAQFFECVAFGHVAKGLVGYEKGERVTLMGELRQSKYTDGEGINRQRVEILVTEVGHSTLFTPTEAEEVTDEVTVDQVTGEILTNA